MDQTTLRQRWGYGASISRFLHDLPESIIGALSRWSGFADEPSQKIAWLEQISILNNLLRPYSASEGAVILEYEIPRLGRRVDTLLLLDQVLFVLEFKVGAETFSRDAIDQVWDSALDLKNFHEASHEIPIVPVVVATKASGAPPRIVTGNHEDDVVQPICCGASGLLGVVELGLRYFACNPIDPEVWQEGATTRLRQSSRLRERCTRDTRFRRSLEAMPAPRIFQ